MDFNLTTPALLFPAISLLLLAYTSRFLALAALARELHGKWRAQSDPGLAAQIANLKRRIRIIKAMQLLGVASFFLCVLTMLLVFVGFGLAGEVAFALALALLLASLSLSLRELFISADALEILLDRTGEADGSGGGLFAQVSIHSPRPGKEEALIDSMRRYGAAVRASPGGIRAHTMKDEGNGVLVGIALWENEEARLAAAPALEAAVAGDDFGELESQPIRGYALREA